MKPQIYFINGPWPGRLAIIPRPRGGDWLEDEVRSWPQSNIDIIVSLLTEGEAAELGLSQEAAKCEAAGLSFISFPIVDRDVPASRSAVIDLVSNLERRLAEGKCVAIHCRQSIGRSALIAACLLVSSGKDAEAAFEEISATRGCPVPDTLAQREWVGEFARETLTLSN